MKNNKHAKKTECEERGHSFRSTTSDTLKVCTRTGCGYTSRLIHDVWALVPPPTPVKKQAPTQPTPILTVFEACDNTSIHVKPAHAFQPRSLADYWQEGGQQ